MCHHLSLHPGCTLPPFWSYDPVQGMKPNGSGNKTKWKLALERKPDLVLPSLIFEPGHCRTKWMVTLLQRRGCKHKPDIRRSVPSAPLLPKPFLTVQGVEGPSAPDPWHFHSMKALLLKSNIQILMFLSLCKLLGDWEVVPDHNRLLSSHLRPKCVLKSLARLQSSWLQLRGFLRIGFPASTFSIMTRVCILEIKDYKTNKKAS